MELKAFLDLEREYLKEERERLNERCPGHPTQDNAIRGQLREIALCDPKNIREKAESVNAKQIKVVPDVKKKDDMDQWISDTFYSHFPGFSNEYQNRQLYLQKRQLENQENLIKHQMLNAGQCRKSKFVRHEKGVSAPNVDSARSNNSSLTSNGTIFMHENGKPDINTIHDTHIPSRDDSLSSVRSSSSRNKLLQDLRHTNLANMINRSTEDEFELNRKQAEIVTAQKKQYQQELMQQIEEKRRTIKMLKDKEIQQEKVLTRRLEEQLKTMKLEEKLEKERIKATKIRYDAEQNHLMREHLLSKLENDSKLLQNTSRAKNLADNELNKENITISNDNKVYKYFSNSEKHEYNYRRKSAIPVGIGVSADLPKIERECFHLSEKICPGCDEPLKEFGDYCLRCQTKNTLPLKVPPAKENIKKSHENHNEPTDMCDSADDFGWVDAESGRSFHLACIKCERFYKLCSTCLKKSDVCKACQSKRNVCMNCRSTLCSFCLEEIACGKDTEKLHANESEGLVNSKTDSQNEVYIQEVSVNGEADHSIGNKSTPRSMQPLDSRHLSMNNLNVYEQQSTLSPNIGRDTIFHQSNITSTHYATNGEHNVNNFQVPEFYVPYSQNDNSKEFEYDEMNIERLRRDTDTRLSRYLKNYSELAFQSRGTQTTPNSTARRDIVIRGEHSLSIPLMREMPRMTRKETTNSRKLYSDDIENLKRRWEIPAVQKQSVSRTSPRVITQIGAVRKQLQTETLFSDDSI